MDPDQAMDIVKHAAIDLKLPISQESIDILGAQFTALNSKTNGGAPTPPMIGSTASTYAAIVSLFAKVTFSAVHW